MVDKVKYAGEEAVGRIADYVNQKLKFVSTMPASPTDKETILYLGTTTQDYQQGGVYEYNKTDDEWILRNLVQTKELTKHEYENLTPEEQGNGVIYFVTDENALDSVEITKLDYENLSPEEKFNGTIYFIVDEDLPGSIIEGYYNTTNGKFYEENTYVTEISGVSHVIYISLDTNTIYRYDTISEHFIMIGGGEDSPELVHVNKLPDLSNVENKIYMIGYASETIDANPASEEKILSIFPEDTLDETSADNWNIESDIFKIYISSHIDEDNYLVSMSHDGTDWTFTDYGTNTYTVPMIDDISFIIEDTRKYYLGDAINHKLEQLFVPPTIPKEVVEGYYKEADGKFYKEATYITEISGETGVIYVSLNTNEIFRYNGSEFVKLGSPEAIQYVDSLPSSNIKDVLYGMVTNISYSDVIADGFLDENEMFEKTASGPGYVYTAFGNTELEASEDDITYLGFKSLAYDGVDWTLTYEDDTTATFADGDTFYYKQIIRLFYAGNKEEQTIIPFTSSSGGGGMSYQAGIGIDITADVISGDYKGDFGIEINDDKIKTTDFIGTQAQWDALPAADKAKYDFIWITDDTTQVTYKPGHSISDGTTEKTQRDGLVFDGFEVTDDSTNEVTKIAEIPYTAGDGIEITNKEVSVSDEISRTWTGTKAEWDAISDKSIYDGWIINITDDAAVGSGPVVDVVEDGNLNAVTSNAVYDTVSKVETQAFDSNFKITRCGRLRTLTVNGRITTIETGSITGLGNTLPEKDWPAIDYVTVVGNCRGSDNRYLPMYVTLHNNNFTGFALDATVTSGYRYMTGTPSLWFTMTYIAKEV